MWHGSVCASGSNASQLSRVEVQQRSAAVVRCAPQALLERTTSQGLCSWIIGSCYAKKNLLNYILGSQYTWAPETTVYPAWSSFLLSYFTLPFLGFLRHIWTPFYNFLSLPLPHQLLSMSALKTERETQSKSSVDVKKKAV